MHGCIGSCMATYGHVLSCLVLHGLVWSSLFIYGHVWSWSCIVLYGIERRSCVNSYEFVCLTQLCTIRACYIYQSIASLMPQDSLIFSGSMVLEYESAPFRNANNSEESLAINVNKTHLN